MTFQKLGTKFQNCFAGGYIGSLCTYDDPADTRSYISLGMKVKAGSEGELKTVYIMVYKLAGYGNSKYPNPLIKIICDCYAQGRPIACCYYEKSNCNIMTCCYANFSVAAPTEDESAYSEIHKNNTSLTADTQDTTR